LLSCSVRKNKEGNLDDKMLVNDLLKYHCTTQNALSTYMLSYKYLNDPNNVIKSYKEMEQNKNSFGLSDDDIQKIISDINNNENTLMPIFEKQSSLNTKQSGLPTSPCTKNKSPSI
ncbi:hypothetical protein, partial [Facilibium subflavum]|uniref:hypothetical protein n=1 Tax=Facilibium subflavum TaxID=2219058 RepID=UPI001AAD9C91